MFSQLNNIAKKLNIPTKITTLNNNLRHTKQDLAFIEQQLFTFPLKSQNYHGGLQIVEAPNRRLDAKLLLVIFYVYVVRKIIVMLISVF